MTNPDQAALQYLKLAALSKEKGQTAGCDRFLVLAGASACKAGCLDVADACRARVMKHNPHHLLKQWPNMAEALRSEEFPPFLHQLERFCAVERAEALLMELGQSVTLDEDQPLESILQSILADPLWEA